MAVCKYHGERAGIGVCMHCRSVICAECTTRLEGINFCHACLRDLGRKSEAASAPRRLRWLTAALLLGGAWIFFTALFWLVEGKFAP